MMFYGITKGQWVEQNSYGHAHFEPLYHSHFYEQWVEAKYVDVTWAL